VGRLNGRPSIPGVQTIVTRHWVVLLLAAISRAALSAQGKPDFSGSWVLESGPIGVDNPRVLSVRQTLTSTTIRGEPMAPFFRDITITRVTAAGSHSETRLIGVFSESVSLGGPIKVPRTRHSATWSEQSLVFDHGTYSGEWTSRREVWSLDADRRLRVEIVARSSVDVPKMAVLLFRRQ
jgi:hypothetical protein